MEINTFSLDFSLNKENLYIPYDITLRGIYCIMGFLGALVVKNPPANARDISDVGSIPGLGRSPGGGHGNPLQYPCLGNPVGRGTWQATVRRAAKSRT